MPYCAKCGSLIDDQDMFCKKCGNPVNNQIIANASVEVSPIALQEKTRSEALVEMKRMIAYFSQKQDLYDEYDECVESINHYSNPRSKVIVPGQSSSSPLFIGAIGRADTIKEAINVIIQDSHNSEMELQAKIAAQAAASTARSSKATAFFTAGTFINTLRR